MADFRKLFLVLAVVAAMAFSANAQTFGCTANPGQPPLIRDGGLAELVGDVVLTCSGTAATPTVTANFQIFMNTTVTNRLSGGMNTQSGLLVNEGLGNAGVAGVSTVVQGVLQPNLVTGDIKNTRNSILYPQVTLPTGTTTTVRIVNIRVVAPPASNTFIPTQVLEFVSTSPVGAIPITQPTQTVAYVQPGLVFAVRGCGDNGFASLNYQQCISQPTGGSGAISFNVKFTEGFLTAFKVQGPGPTVPGTPTVTESGLTFPAANPVIEDIADTGTRLIVRFTNIPAGVSFAVTDTQVGTGTNQGTSGAMVGDAFVPDVTAVLVSVTDPTGTGGSAANALTGSTATTCSTGSHLVNVPVTAGTGSATWEITHSTTGPAANVISFGVQVKYTANTTAGLPGLTTTPASVNGNFAPISSVDYADSSSALPRFLDKPQGSTVFSIGPCVTNILFPYVTNQGGFDTGIALVNTSLDDATGAPTHQPFSTNTQHGACTVYYFGSMLSGGALPTPQTTTDIAAGQMYTFAISQGGVGGATTSAVGFQGYIIARCNFQFAHGYAFVSDMGAQKLAHGYLALIIPDKGASSRNPDPFTAAGAGSGEQLAP